MTTSMNAISETAVRWAIASLLMVSGIDTLFNNELAQISNNMHVTNILLVKLIAFVSVLGGMLLVLNWKTSLVIPMLALVMTYVALVLPSFVGMLVMTALFLLMVMPKVKSKQVMQEDPACSSC